jgi:hypothetical protein
MLGVWGLGLALFLDQARTLLSDAQFTWGERQVMGIVALVTIGGCALGGWVLGRLLRSLGDLLEILVDSAEAAWRTGDLIEQHVVPLLGRIAASLETASPTDQKWSANVANPSAGGRFQAPKPDPNRQPSSQPRRGRGPSPEE